MAQAQVEDLGPLTVEDLGPIGSAKKPTESKLTPLQQARARIAARQQALKGHEPLYEAARAAVRGAVSSVQTLASPIRKLTGMPPATPPPEETSTAGKVGRGLEQAAEFFVPEMGAEKAIAALPKMGKVARVATKAALTGLGSAGVAKAQGDTRPAIAGAVGAAGPIIEGLGPLAYKWARTASKERLGQFFGASELKPKAVRDTIRDLVPVALDEGIPSSWEAWAKQAREGVARKGAAVQSTVAGPAGATWVPLHPVVDSLDDLAKRSAQVMMPTPTTGGQMVNVPVMTKDDALLRSIKLLKTKLQQLPTNNGMVPARTLHELKSTWNELARYGAEATKQGRASTKLAAKTKGYRAVTGAIRDVLDTNAPQISEVDQAYHVARDLHQAVVDAALESTGQIEKKVASGVSGVLRRSTATGITSGALIGGQQGYQREGVPGLVGGAIVGGVTGRMLERAFQSPLWKARTPKMLDALADAIASRRAEDVRRLLSPFLVKTVAGGARE